MQRSRNSRDRMRRAWSICLEDRGSASLEFITAGMILLVPLVYLILTLSAVQAGALAAEGAARQAARVFVQSGSVESAEEAASRAVDFALADYGITPEQAHVEVSCEPAPRDCLRRRGFVTVSVRVAVALPLAPAAVDVDAPLSVKVSSQATQQVSRFWGAG